MEVTHIQDHVTHTIIGGGKAESFGISDDPAFFHVLSSTLYRDKKRAVVRETLCNAWDAHIEAGLTSLPIEVTLTDKELKIQDFGTGIDKNLIKPIYGVYGSSTKKDNINVTGGFGLGCKAPFAYVDHFEVTSCHLGEKTIYRMSKSSGAVMGKPSILPIVTIPTDDSGITVSMAVASNLDKIEFRKLIVQIAKLGEMKVKLNGELIESLPFSEAKHGYLMVREDDFGAGSEHAIQLRYGHVCYPIETHEAYGSLYNKALEFMSKITFTKGYYGDRNRSGWVLILQAPPNSISVTPSRESLSMTDHTVETLKELFDKFIANTKSINLKEVCLDLTQKAINTIWLNSTPTELLTTFGSVPNRKAIEVFSSPYITDVAHAGGHYLRNTYPNFKTYRHKEHMMRLDALIQSQFGKRGLIQTFRREYMRSKKNKYVKGLEAHGHQWFIRRVIYPIYKAMETEPLLDKKRLFVWGRKSKQNGYNTYYGTINPMEYGVSLQSYLPILRGLVIVAYNRTDIECRAHQFPMMKHWFGSPEGSLCYMVPRTSDRAKAAVELFQRLGYQVLDLTKRAAFEPELVLEPMKKEAPLFKRRKGFAQISELGSTFNMKKLYDEYNIRIEKPEYYVVLNPRKDGLHSFPYFNREMSEVIIRLWGNKGCAAKTCSQITTILSQNKDAIEITPWVKKQLLEQYKYNSEIKKHHQMTAYLDDDLHPHFSTDADHDQILQMIMKDPFFRKELNVVHEPTQEILDIVNVFRWFPHWDKSRDELKVCSDLIKTWGVDPEMKKVIDSVINSRLIKIFNPHQVGAALSAGSSLTAAQKDTVRKIILSAVKG